MSQTVTFTRTSGGSVTVEIDATDNNADNISDAEANQAFERALAQPGVTRESLIGGTMTIGSATLPTDRYTSLMPAAAPSPDDASATGSTLRYALHRPFLDLVGSGVWGNGGAEPSAGVDLGYLHRWRLSSDGRTTGDFGGGVGLRWFGGRPTALSLEMSDLDTGVQSRDFTGNFYANPFLRFQVLRHVSDHFALGGFLDLGLGILSGRNVAHRLSGPGYDGAYCPGDGGGIFGDDVTGCENRPGGAHTERDSNDTSSSDTNFFFTARAAAAMEWSPADRFTLRAFVGPEAMVGGTSRVGVFGGLGLAIPLGTVEPAAPPRNTGPTTDEAVDKTSSPIAPTVTATGQARISLTADQVRDLANLPAGATIHGVTFDSGTEDTSAPYEFDATPGRHTLTVRYSRPGETDEHVRDVRITVGPVVTSSDDVRRSGVFGGVSPTTSVTRPSAPGAGVTSSPDISLGSVTPRASLPAGSTLSIRVGDRTVREGIELSGGEAADLTLPAYRNEASSWVPQPYATDGSHDRVQLVVMNADGHEIERMDWPSYTVAPATSIGTPAPAMGAASYSSRSRDAATVIINMTRAIPSGVTVSVNGRTMTAAEFNGSLSAGANTITLKNPDMRMNSNVRGVRAGSYPVVINIPGEAPITLQLVITRPRGGGGGGTGGSVPRPPRR